MMVMDIQFANQNPYFDLFEYKAGSDEYRPLTLAAFAENQFEHEDYWCCKQNQFLVGFLNTFQVKVNFVFFCYFLDS
jgi:hypothetical protein